MIRNISSATRSQRLEVEFRKAIPNNQDGPDQDNRLIQGIESEALRFGRLKAFGLSIMETLPNHECPRCGRMQMNIYFSSNADEKLDAWCENCNLRACYHGESWSP